MSSPQPPATTAYERAAIEETARFKKGRAPACWEAPPSRLVRFLLIIEKLPLQGRGWRSGYVAVQK
jgi:hypothetical protein